MKKLNLKLLLTMLLSITFLLLLLTFTKGAKGNPLYFQHEKDTRIEGPFESSNSTSRYALVESMAQNHSFVFDLDQAKFASPDMVRYNGNFFSIFTPGVSFIAVPFYIVGALIGFPQLITYLSILIFAFINIFLVAKISSKLGANIYSSIFSGFIFLFATNALAYSQTLTQHHMSITFILLCLLNALEKRTIKNNLLFGTYLGISLLLDIPNVLILLPVIGFVFAKHFDKEVLSNKLKLTFKPVIIMILIGILPFIVLFGYYNLKTAGSPIKIGQTIGRSSYFKTSIPKQDTIVNNQTVITKSTDLISIPFRTRNEVTGLYTLLLSNERSWIFYSPILFLGIIGLFLAYRNKNTSILAKLSASVILFDIIFYSMFGDPWGGWSFGARYLLPAAAILAAGIGVLIQNKKKNILFIVIFFILLSYSFYVSVLGTLTTNAIPPKIEAVNLKPQIPYTYEYNQRLVVLDKSGNLLYNLYLSNYLDLSMYLESLLIMLLVLSGIQYLLILKTNEKNN